ncbi:hypothetical protein TrVFT333_005663 [Trichoderma virens FT-333]|nr:hypothetical protein TrVFT333_005663 [Trichoderma virens FT-333]
MMSAHLILLPIYPVAREEGITLPDEASSGTLSSDVQSVKAYIPNCALVIWVNGGGWYPLVIRPGDSSCYELTGPGRGWNLSC